MIESYVRNVIEAALLAAGRPLGLGELKQLFDAPSCPDDATLRAALEQLAGEYAERGIELKEIASGWRIQVRREFAQEISRLWPERPARYSRALLETLALIAYRQPITRGEIEDVRGVAVNPNIIKTLLERNWVRVLGHRDVPGRPELLGTTREFLDYFGLRRLEELPPLAQLKALSEPNLELDLPALPSGAPEGLQEALETAPVSDAQAQPQSESKEQTAPRAPACAEEGEAGPASAAEPQADTEAPQDERRQLRAAADDGRA
ncbi:MAG: SMC-Scp complex subunit ScpB [Steroidobacteraceae bacterium]